MAREIALPFDVHTTALEEYLLLQALHRLIPPGQRWALPGHAGLLVRNDILEMAMRLLTDSSRDLYLNYAEGLPAYLRRCIDTYMPVPYGSLSPSASRAEFLSWHLLNDGDAPLWTAVRTAVSALSWQRGRQTFSRHAECNVTFGAFGRGPYVGLCSLTAQHGSFCRLMNRLINHLKPDHIWSSISISKNMLTPPHRDQQNHVSDTLLVGLSHFDEGGVWVEGEGGCHFEDTPCGLRGGFRHCITMQALLFPAHSHFHCTNRWSFADRITLAAYCARPLQHLKPADASLLEELGFQLP